VLFGPSYLRVSVIAALALEAGAHPARVIAECEQPRRCRHATGAGTPLSVCALSADHTPACRRAALSARGARLRRRIVAGRGARPAGRRLAL
jgi:hypothetical protein